MELIRPLKQSVWRGPAFANFVLGGMGAGLYLWVCLVSVFQVNGPAFRLFALGEILAPTLVAVGFLVLAFEAGRPLRGYRLLRNLRCSWMSRETVAAVVFLPFAYLDLLFPNWFFQLAAAIGAMALMISHGFIVYRARGVLFWNMPLIPILFTTSNLYTGLGLILFLSAFGLMTPEAYFLLTGLLVLGLNLWVWVTLVSWKGRPALRQNKNVFRRPISLTFIVGIGHVLPILLLIRLTYIAGLPLDALDKQLPILLAGLSILAAGIWQKLTILVSAAYMRPIAVGRRKNRTQGTEAHEVAAPSKQEYPCMESPLFTESMKNK